jgi:hypothetical protein
MTQNILQERSITIRRTHDADEPVLRQLAQLDSGRVPSAPALGAEIDGRLIASISIESGEVVADPFVQSAEAVDLLRLRRAQLDGFPRKRRFRRRARAALPASPPGAGGRLIKLPSSDVGWARIT